MRANGDRADGKWQAPTTTMRNVFAKLERAQAATLKVVTNDDDYGDR